jgi:hypothetical protein
MVQFFQMPKHDQKKHKNVSVRAKIGAFVIAASLALSACSTNAARPTTATIKVPVVAGSTLKVGDKATIEGNATGTNITRVEVLVNGQLYATQTTQDPTQGVTDFKMSPLPWSPSQSGTNVVQMRVYDKDNKKIAESDPVIVVAQGDSAPVANPPAQPTSAPATQPTQAPPPPTTAPTVAAPAKPAAEASIIVTNEFVNVRSGPGTGFNLLGKLDKGNTAKLLGRSEDGNWWQVQFGNAKGWVFGEYVKAENANLVSVVTAPAEPVTAPKPTAAAPSVPLQSLPTAPPVVAPAPAAPVVVVTPASVQPVAPPTGATVGVKGLLRVNTAYTQQFGTVVASWDVQNINRAEFDSGDGRGFQPAGGTMTVNVSGLNGTRTLRLKIIDKNNVETIDEIQVRGDAAYGTVSGGGPATGSAGLLKVNQQIVPVNGTVVASWSVQNVKEVLFDKGDGGGYKAAAGEMSVNVDGINGTRTLRLRVVGNDGSVREDSIVVRSDNALGTQAAASSSSSGDCTTSDPNYRDKDGKGPYKFCVAKDLGWKSGTPNSNSVQKFKIGEDRQITLEWNFYGIAGIRLAADPSDQIKDPECTSAGKGDKPFGKDVNGNDTHTFNIKDMGKGQYKFEMFVKRRDGETVGHNEIFLCIY